MKSAIRISSTERRIAELEATLDRIIADPASTDDDIDAATKARDAALASLERFACIRCGCQVDRPSERYCERCRGQR